MIECIKYFVIFICIVLVLGYLIIICSVDVYVKCKYKYFDCICR